MKQLFAMLLFVAIISGCGKKNDAICGAAAHWESDVSNDFIHTDLDFLTGTRTLIYEDINEPKDICPAEHTTVNFAVTPINNIALPTNVKVYGKIYLRLTSQQLQLSWDGVNGVYTGTMNDVSLSEVYGDEPGSISIQVKFEFPTMGSFAADSAYINSNVVTMGVGYDYNKEL